MKNKNFNFRTHQFHCSALPQIMTNARKKDEELSQTAMSYLDDLFIEYRYGRKKYITSPAMEKGTIVESDSIQLYCDVTKQSLFKNNGLLQNELIIGTPDVTTPLIDIKSSQDIWTFHKVNENDANSNYFWQLAGYAMLLNVYEAQLVYVLVDTPEHLIVDEVMRTTYKLDDSKHAEVEDQIRKNLTYSDIPERDRIKSFTFEFTDQHFDAIREKVHVCRSYLIGQTL